MSEAPSEIAKRILAREDDTTDPELVESLANRDDAVLARAYLYLKEKYHEASEARYENLVAAQTVSHTCLEMLARLEAYREIVDTVLEWRAVALPVRSDNEAKLWRLADKERIRRSTKEQ
jgi:hypothetical protein